MRSRTTVHIKLDTYFIGDVMEDFAMHMVAERGSSEFFPKLFQLHFEEIPPVRCRNCVGFSKDFPHLARLTLNITFFSNSAFPAECFGLI